MEGETAMVLGPTHALSGAAAWLAASLLITERQTPVELAIGTVVCAGAALLPDLDCSGRVISNRGGATVARTFGVASLFVAECVEKFALLVYRLTKTRRDPRRTNGHRTLTHTWVFNVALGAGVALLCARFGKPAVIAVLFLTVGLAIRGLLADWAQKHGWVIVTATSALVAYHGWQLLPTRTDFPLLGLAVGLGGVVHTLGDMVTRAGCPVLWPLPIAGKRWRAIGLPRAAAVKVGGIVERLLLRPLLILAALVAAVVLVVPGVLPI